MQVCPPGSRSVTSSVEDVCLVSNHAAPEYRGLPGLSSEITFVGVGSLQQEFFKFSKWFLSRKQKGVMIKCTKTASGKKEE